LLIAFPNADDPLSANHESLKSKISKRKNARSNTPLSCNIQSHFKTNSAYFSGRTAFFTDDYRGSTPRVQIHSRAAVQQASNQIAVFFVSRLQILAAC
jgi:hypothetical protein